MAQLNKNWITEKLIDFEYKKYILLAYLKEVSNNFVENKLYPSMTELIEHYKLLMAIKENKQSLLDAFPQRMQKLDWERFRISYEKIIQDDKIMSEIENIIDYSLPHFEHYLTEGKNIYDFIEEQLHIYPIGVIPLYPEHGYMFLKDGANADTRVYQYQITIFEQPNEKYRGIHTEYIKSYSKSFSNSFESIKTDLIKEHRNIPNPATFAIETELVFPLEESLLPIAKRALAKHVGQKQ